jgi:hypothetical protein
MRREKNDEKFLHFFVSSTGATDGEREKEAN